MLIAHLQLIVMYFCSDVVLIFAVGPELLLRCSVIAQKQMYNFALDLVVFIFGLELGGAELYLVIASLG